MDLSAESSSPTPKPTKYRLACDSCQHSKIRCDQERPRCCRCAKKGIECVYSPARRAGRPRTRNTNKSSTSVEKITSSLRDNPAPTTEHNSIPISNSDWIPPFTRLDIPSVAEDHSSASSSSNISTVPATLQTVQLGSSDMLDFSHYQHTETDFLQGLPDFTESQCDTPQQTTSYYYPMSPNFHIAPELLDIGFCEAASEHEQQQELGHNQSTSAAMLLDIDVELPYFGLPTPEDQDLDQHHELTPMRTARRNNIETCSFTICPQQEVQSNVLQLSDHPQPLTEQCNCVATLLNHLSTPSHANSAPFLASTSAALSTSRALVTCCCTIMACPNACSTRPSTALIICEAIDRAITSLKLGGSSLWTPTVVPGTSPENATYSSPSSSSSPSNTSDHSGNDMMLPSVVDEEHEPLRCGTMPIRGADRRAVMRVLLAKRVLDMQQVLERLRDTLLSGLLVGGHTAVKKPVVALCADIVGEFAGKMAQRMETFKLRV